jgi:glycerophosphoryl diester phosphodiesterase
VRIRGIAHRGCPDKHPENTLAGYQAAIDLGFTHLELDVHLSKDGVPVVIHDSTVNRMCNARGKVKDFTLAELKELTVGGRETIPTLEEALRLAKDRIQVFVELKNFVNNYEGIEAKTLQTVHALGMADQVIMMSFDHYSLLKVRELDSKVAICLIMGCLTPAAFPFMKQIGSEYLWMPHSFLTREYAQECQSNKVELIANPIDTEEVRRRLLEQFPTALASTNHLEEWREFYMRNLEALG